MTMMWITTRTGTIPFHKLSNAWPGGPTQNGEFTMPDDQEKKPNGWDQYSRLVLSELRQLNEGQDTIRVDMGNLRVQFLVDMGKIRTEIALLKQSATIRGLIAGSIPGVLAAIAALVWYFTKGG